MAQTPSRVRLTLPAQLLLEVAGSGVQQKVADIELPIVVLVGTDENGTAPTIQVAPIQDTPLDLDRGPMVDVGGHTMMSAVDLPDGVEGHIVNRDGTLGDAVRGTGTGLWTKVEQPPQQGILGHEPKPDPNWSMPGQDARCPNHRMHSAHTWGQIEGSPTAEQIMARQVKVTHYHCPGA